MKNQMSAAEFATMLEIQKSMASHLFNMLSRKNYGKKRVTISKIRHRLTLPDPLTRQIKRADARRIAKRSMTAARCDPLARGRQYSRPSS